MPNVDDVRAELAPALRTAARATRAVKFVNRLAVLIAVIPVAGTVMQYFDVSSPAKDSSLDVHVDADRYAWGLFFRESAWAIALAGVAIGIAIVVKAVASAVIVDVTRAEIEATRRAPS
jgi:hypothetical protein